MNLQLNKSDFQCITEPTGYMVYFKGHGVCGAGTLTSNYMNKYRGNWRTKQADRKMYYEMGQRDIDTLIQDGEQGQWYSRLVEINNIFTIKQKSLCLQS